MSESTTHHIGRKNNLPAVDASIVFSALSDRACTVLELAHAIEEPARQRSPVEWARAIRAHLFNHPASYWVDRDDRWHLRPEKATT